MYDSSGPNPAPGVPVDNYQKTRYYLSANTAVPGSSPTSYETTYSTNYTSTNQGPPTVAGGGATPQSVSSPGTAVHDNMIAIKGGVYEKAEFITSTIGGGGKAQDTIGDGLGNNNYRNNVVFIDTGSTSPLSYGPIVPYSTVQGTGTAGSGLGSNIESNVGWTASTINATAGFHSQRWACWPTIPAAQGG